MSVSWHLIPGKSLGPIVFGGRAKNFIRRLRLRRLPPAYDEADWESWKVPRHKVNVYTKDGQITDVLTHESCIVDGWELIHATLKEVRKNLGRESEYRRDWGAGDAAFYDHLGLTLWLEQGRVTSVSSEQVEDENTNAEPI